MCTAGTKQHQRTLRSIQKRSPAIRKAILRYNALCAKARELLPADKDYPLPEELSTDLTDLKNDPSLLDDVWVSSIPGDDALWLKDPRVRNAIRSQLALDRCTEERKRLTREESQLYDWLALESCAIARAMYDPESTSLVLHLPAPDLTCLQTIY